jgi:hypothetical protein
MVTSGRIVIEHSTHHPMTEDLSRAATVSTSTEGKDMQII